ncbi:unnamed protein product [Cunninghamella blakesleeana]
MEWAIKKIQDLCTYTSSPPSTLITLPPITVKTSTLSLKENPLVPIECSSCTLPCSYTNIPNHLIHPDKTRPLHNTVPTYALHLVIFTGRSDWPGHLEDESFTGDLISCLDKKRKSSSLQQQQHRKNENTFHLYDYINNKKNDTSSTPSTSTSSFKHQRVLVTNTSLSSIYSTSSNHYDILLLPDNVIISNVSRKNINQFVDFIFGQPTFLFQVQPSPWDQYIMICGHLKKDKRCGTIGPLLHQSFEKIIQEKKLNRIQVMLVSHLGGHAFAGNVVLYTHHGLRAIWYGRVNSPCKCEEIINHSICKDQVLQQHLRGILQVGEERYDTPLTPIPSSSLDW